MGIEVHDMFKFSGYGYFIIALLKFIGIIEDPFFMFSASITALIIVVCDYNASKIEKRLKLAKDSEDNMEIDKLEKSYKRTGQFLVLGFVVGLLILPNSLPYIVPRLGMWHLIEVILPNINDGLALATLGLTFIVMSVRQSQEKQYSFTSKNNTVVK
ncbi:hypothetical protein Q9G86_06385 [Bacillus thuringiensis]|uniref:hypothetical protein n=1 Tax=Bacillus thuringiensis TaxID=1428 RepID=UPI00273B53C6|nr:hypothetical protein [Bacillus thuringiensis]WLP65380.1 hypothetical protein Q9G86_06385 [Bacillus thuringiensis]